LADRLHYLNSSGDKTQEATRFWFDTRANLRREMEDRKRRFDDGTDVRGKIGEALKKMVGSATFFDGVHIFTPHGDVPDDSALRLVVLAPENCHSRDLKQPAEQAVLDYVRNNGTKPRYRGNRLVFLAPNMTILARLRDSARVALAWNSIVDDVKEGRLNIDLLQKKQAEKELQSAEEVVPPKTFHGSILIKPSAAKMRLVQVAEEIISLLASDPNASLNITLEINAEFPSGASDQIKRAVTENATSLGFQTKAWE
jgi:predicted AAA+ superfamily ATPase